MAFILPEDIERYVEEYTSPVPLLLEELEMETCEKTAAPEMLSGRVEGRLLQMLIRVSGAKKVLEIGTFTGYSALMMAEGLPEEGELITCEISKEYADIAGRYFKKSPYEKKIRLKLGPAAQTIQQIPGESMDFVIIDADKVSYSLYYEESLRILKKGGLVAVDNTLWSGLVLDPHDENSRSIASFNKKVKGDESVEKVMLTVRDGVYLIRKK